MEPASSNGADKLPESKSDFQSFLAFLGIPIAWILGIFIFVLGVLLPFILGFPISDADSVRLDLLSMFVTSCLAFNSVLLLLFRWRHFRRILKSRLLHQLNIATATLAVIASLAPLQLNALEDSNSRIEGQLSDVKESIEYFSDHFQSNFCNDPQIDEGRVDELWNTLQERDVFDARELVGLTEIESICVLLFDIEVFNNSYVLNRGPWAPTLRSEHLNEYIAVSEYIESRISALVESGFLDVRRHRELMGNYFLGIENAAVNADLLRRHNPRLEADLRQIDQQISPYLLIFLGLIGVLEVYIISASKKGN